MHASACRTQQSREYIDRRIANTTHETQTQRSAQDTQTGRERSRKERRLNGKKSTAAHDGHVRLRRRLLFWWRACCLVRLFVWWREYGAGALWWWREYGASALRRWREDRWAQAPYQYSAQNCVHVCGGGQQIRRLTPTEEEVLMGYPAHFTQPVCELYGDKKIADANHKRQFLLGNAWHLGAVTFLLRVLLLPMMVVQGSELTPDMSKALSRMHPDHANIYRTMRSSCPYLLARIRHGRSVSLPLGPDWAEQNAHKAASTAEGVQPRSLGAASGGVRRGHCPLRRCVQRE